MWFNPYEFSDYGTVTDVGVVLGFCELRFSSCFWLNFRADGLVLPLLTTTKVMSIQVEDGQLVQPVGLFSIVPS